MTRFLIFSGDVYYMYEYPKHINSIRPFSWRNGYANFQVDLTFLNTFWNRHTFIKAEEMYTIRQSTKLF